MFEKVKLGRASDKVVQQIREVILSGQLVPGDRLPSERELAEGFGLSRMTVRDALRVLESRGLIEIKVGAAGGAFVREPNLDLFKESLSTVIQTTQADYMELAEARKIVEIAVVDLAAQRATKKDIEALREAVESAKSALKNGESGTEYSVAFHAALARASQNYILNLMVDSFRSFFSEALQQVLTGGRVSSRGLKEHETIMKAVEAGDRQKARETMARHLEAFEAMVRKFEKRNRNTSKRSSRKKTKR